MIKVLEHLSYKDRMRDLRLFSLERERALERPYCGLSVYGGAYKKTFYTSCTDSNGFKLKDGRLRLDIKKKFFIMKVVRQWNRLLTEAVGAPFPASV